MYGAGFHPLAPRPRSCSLRCSQFFYEGCPGLVPVPSDKGFFVSSSAMTAAWAPTRIWPFKVLYFSTLSRTRRNSWSEISPPIRSVDMWSAIVFNWPRASTRISPCFLSLTTRRQLTTLPATPSSPQVRAVASSPNTTGATTMVDRRPTHPMPIPILAVSRAVSTPSAALKPRRYFMYRAARLSRSSLSCSFRRSTCCSRCCQPGAGSTAGSSGYRSAVVLLAASWYFDRCTCTQLGFPVEARTFPSL